MPARQRYPRFHLRVCSSARRSSESEPSAGIATRLTPAAVSVASVSGEWTPRSAESPVGGMLEDLLVVLDRLGGLPMLVGVREDLIARDDPPIDFIKDDMATKLDEGTAFVPRDGPCVRLEEAEHLLLRCHLLAVEHSAACLSNHLLHQRQHLLGLREQALGLRLGLLAQCLDHACGLLHHLLGRLDQLLVQLLLLGLFFFSLAPQLPMQRLGRLAR